MALCKMFVGLLSQFGIWNCLLITDGLICMLYCNNNYICTIVHTPSYMDVCNYIYPSFSLWSQALPLAWVVFLFWFILRFFFPPQFFTFVPSRDALGTNTKETLTIEDFLFPTRTEKHVKSFLLIACLFKLFLSKNIVNFFVRKA